MRRLLQLTLQLTVLSAVLSLPAFAQTGVWTGYVGGWQWAPQPQQYVPAPWRVQRGPYVNWSSRNRTAIRSADVSAGAIALSQLAAQNAYFSQMNLVERQKENARREADELATRSALLDQRERALAQQQVEQAWQAAEQQRQAALAERRQLELKEKEADEARAQLAAAQLALQQKELEISLAQREKEIAAREAERMARPRTPGPTVYKWIDEDGVMHFSTKKK
ncbi:MAG: DUF4124 domain-containing protein [Archangium sp.]|nr:DUF4124 domain-containing protein [Archangium sp.]